MKKLFDSFLDYFCLNCQVVDKVDNKLNKLKLDANFKINTIYKCDFCGILYNKKHLDQIRAETSSHD